MASSPPSAPHLKEVLPRASRFNSIIRVIALFFYFCITIPLFYILVPVLLLHPILRYFGVPEVYLPMEILQRLEAWGTLMILGVTVEVIFEEPPSKTAPTSEIVMCNHLSNLDSMIITGFSGRTPKFIMKRELLFNPVGIVFWLYGHIPINRKNREKAFASIRKASDQMEKLSCSIAIFPEGTRSVTGEIMDFKKGGFHMACNSGISIRPMILQNTFEILPPKCWAPTPGHSVLYVMPPVEVKKGSDVNKTLETVREKMIEGQKKLRSKPLRIRPGSVHREPFIPVLFLGVVFGVGFAVFQAYFT